MPIDDHRKVITSVSSAILVGQIRRPSRVATELVVELQGPRALEIKDPWRTRAIDRLGIVMRVVGGSLPCWIDPVQESAPACILDLVVIRSVSQLSEDDYWSVPAINCTYRVIIASEEVEKMYGDLWARLPRADIAVFTPSSNVVAVAYCLASIASGGGIVSVDWGGVLEVVKRRGSQVTLGRATIVSGQGYEAGRAAQDALATLEKEANIAGIFLFQFISIADTPSYNLWSMELLSTAAMGDRDKSKLLLTGAYDRQCTEVVVIAFEEQSSCRPNG